MLNANASNQYFLLFFLLLNGNTFWQHYFSFSSLYILNLVNLTMFPGSNPSLFLNLLYITISPCTLPPLSYSCSEVLNLVNMTMLPGTLPSTLPPLSLPIFSKPVQPDNASCNISPLSPTCIFLTCYLTILPNSIPSSYTWELSWQCIAYWH